MHRAERLRNAAVAWRTRQLLKKDSAPNEVDAMRRADKSCTASCKGECHEANRCRSSHLCGPYIDITALRIGLERWCGSAASEDELMAALNGTVGDVVPRDSQEAGFQDSSATSSSSSASG